MGTGHAAGVEKPVPTDVSTGRSLLGTHAPVVRGRADAIAVCADSETTSSNVTVCALESLNASVIDPS
jgi:hypothetical protein